MSSPRDSVSPEQVIGDAKAAYSPFAEQLPTATLRSSHTAVVLETASASSPSLSSSVSRSNEFALPRRDMTMGGSSGPRAIPFYAATTSITKESSGANAGSQQRPSSAAVPTRASAGAGTSSRMIPTSTPSDASSSASLLRPILADHELTGRLFGASGARRQSGSRERSLADYRRGSLPGIGAPTTTATTRCDPSRGSENPGDFRSVDGLTNLKVIRGDCQPIEESLFYADVLFMWMGVNSTQYFTYDPSADVYRLAPETGGPMQQQAAEVFQECGVLARHIDVALRQPSATGDSFLQQSLRSALRRQLTQYHYLVSMLRERRNPPLHMGDLVVAYKRVHPKLWVMDCVLRETQHVKGGELASRMQQLVQNGSHRLASLLHDIYIETVSPLLHMTVESITKGDVCDPMREFYIVPKDDIDDAAENFWVAKYVLNTDMLPRTVPESVAQDILLVTKNIRFICRCCRAKQWRMDASLVAEAERATFDTLPAVVHRALVFTNTAVLRLIREEFQLHEVLRLVNAFLLVGYGDFYELLIMKLEPVLSKMSSAVHVSVVRDQVHGALAEITPYARHLDTERFALLQCELVKDEAKLGWDTFVMTMHVPSPLNNVFDHSAMKVYRRLFRLMFRVKVAEVALKRAWRQNVVLDRLISSVQRTMQERSAWREVAADAHLLGLQLNHFVNNLWSYLVAEVCTVAQDLLLKAVEQCASMDDIRTAHNTYLAYLTQRSLLHTNCATIRMNVENILTIVREYCGSQALLASLLQRGAGDLSTVKRQYQSLTDDFHREISSLLTTLEEQHVHFDFLNFLLLRLNFNRFYHDTSDTAYNTEF
ncbi:gamma-tubulin complex subunit, putative [Leishmania tarentolae]|uniref:Gamma-tubulin complex subunit, putative n=1 Tax=Leishmania tarentolae TaxID=5689 RepID=A0A640KRP4_LEITA|nr:gamma-tubulin complex subunit, putative [Leishmania tarentolae]